MGGHYRYNPGMPVKRVLVREGADLLAQGYSYIDVRSVPEFQAGHPAGAYNIPIVHIVPGRGRMPNMDFAAVVEKHFPRDAKLLLGCGSGPRSLRAAELLQQAGWTDVVDLRPGFEGERDMGGRVVNPGWRDAGLPVETAAPGRTWDELSK
jgi:rhodanese-related sulfurtransferase